MDRPVRPLFALGAVSALAWALWVPASAEGATSCRVTAGPPDREVSLSLDVLSPPAGGVVQAGHRCEAPLSVSGEFRSLGAGYSDLYLALDTSFSTSHCSGVDVNRDGVLCGADGSDSIYQGEMEASLRLVDALDPRFTRIALITFSGVAVLRHPLTSDLASVAAALERLRTEEGPAGNTSYSAALRMIGDEVRLRGGSPGRQQRGLLLSDGIPNLVDLGLIDPEARSLAAMDVRVDTFALGGFAAQKLMDIASITGGTFQRIQTPGDVISLLPSTAGAGVQLVVRNETTAREARAVLDGNDGTFDSQVTLVPGRNRLVAVLSTTGASPVELACPFEVELALPLPEDVGSALRVERSGSRDLRLDWSSAAAPYADQHYRVFRADDREGPFERISPEVPDRGFSTPAGPGEPLEYFDVRTANCGGEVSRDPFPPQTRALDRCWTPPRIPAGYPVASNLSDPACRDRFSTHPCDPGVDLSGTDREFLVVADAPGEMVVEVSDPSLWAIVYDPAGACAGMGRGRVEVPGATAGLWRVVVDAPPGGGAPFDLSVILR